MNTKQGDFGTKKGKIWHDLQMTLMNKKTRNTMNFMNYLEFSSRSLQMYVTLAFVPDDSDTIYDEAIAS